jgi:biotin transport system substrate-specific component
VLFFVALTAASAQVSFPVPFTAVPFTLQPMIVLLGGLMLGSRLGFLAQAAYLAAGIAGLPVFAASPLLPTGALRLLGPSGGFLMAYPLAAYVTGLLAERGFDRRYATSILAMGAGLALVYASGIIWLGLFARTVAGTAATGFAAAATTGVSFLLPDVLKLCAAAGIVPSLRRLLGRRG